MFYQTLNDHDPKRKKVEYPSHMLYTACAEIKGEINGCVFAYNHRLVAFWDAFDQRVRAGFGATEAERTSINEGFRIGRW
jgi:hypothetical protein